ncbi:hypothetical protein [Streptomyces sp. NBC_01310]|uniref:hypothetical protein n=1 Tax=Streptomyces sp. NBC_01310 TaxID=2903820 RepID=UPI0035B6233E
MLTALATGLVLAAPGTLATPAAAATAPAVTPESTSRLELPRPTGAFTVGRDTLHLVDRERKNPWVPAAERELLLSLYYPALALPADHAGVRRRLLRPAPARDAGATPGRPDGDRPGGRVPPQLIPFQPQGRTNSGLART